MKISLLRIFILCMVAKAIVWETPADELASLWLIDAQEKIAGSQYHEALRIIAQQLATDKDEQRLVDGWLLKATALQKMGKFNDAHDAFKVAGAVAERSANRYQLITVLMRYSDFHMVTGNRDKGLENAQLAIIQARQLGNKRLLAQALNNLGNALYLTESLAAAGDAYDEGFQIASQLGQSELVIHIQLNRLQLAIELSRSDEAVAIIRFLEPLINALTNESQKAEYLLSLGYLTAQNSLIVNEEKLKAELRLTAWRIYNDVAAISASINGAQLESYAQGYLGQLYESDGLYDDALRLTQRALRVALQCEAPEILYQWQWQLGRILEQLNRIPEAIEACEIATKTLNPIRNRLSTGMRKKHSTFQSEVKPVYYQLAKLYLREAGICEGDQRQSYLRKTIDTLEMLKSAELEDYFQDECVNSLQRRSDREHWDRVTNTAFIYPILFRDQLVVLLMIQGKIHEFPLAVEDQTVKNTVQEFRLNLQKRASKRFYYQAKSLYEWLIRPLEAVLSSNHITTLILIPDETLRLIPFSSLYDGEKFLIEKWALASTPGMQLTDPHKVDHSQLSAMIAGLSIEVQEFAALANVTEEVESIQKTLSGYVMINEEYTTQTIQNQLRMNEYGIIHLATHGEFDRDPNKTFILAYDEKISMDKLESIIKLRQFHNHPIELLTLSACKTAVGDERSALGLAGIAVKSGARSVIASLWYVGDESAKKLITEFYQQMSRNDSISKAEAMRQAQMSMLAERRFQHPVYWSPFLLIGNWL